MEGEYGKLSHCIGMLWHMPDIYSACSFVEWGRGPKEQKLLILIMCGSLVQNVGYLLELTAPTLEAAMTAVIVENVGSVFVPLCYCWFIYIYCYIAPPKTFLRILGVISFFALPSVFFNWHGLFYKEVQWIADANGFYHISLTYGPLYMVFMFSRIIDSLLPLHIYIGERYP